MSDKTEKPTARRLQKARTEGDSPVSAVLSQSVGFAAALAVVGSAASALIQRASALISAALARPSSPVSATELATLVLAISVPILCAAAVGSAAASFAQTGGAFSLGKLAPSFDRLNLFDGLKGLVTWQRIVGLLRALVAAGLVAWFSLRTLMSYGASFAAATGDISAAVTLAAATAKRVAWFAAAIGLGLGIIDLLLTRRAWLTRHRMSKDEIKREYRESEGDPAVKAARRRAHQEALLGATLNALKTASVVIVNPTHLATALKYTEDEDAAPAVVAQGQGEMAKLIIETARAYGVPIVRDVPVARALNDLEIGDEIPEALYEAVAEILKEIWQGEALPAATP